MAFSSKTRGKGRERLSLESHVKIPEGTAGIIIGKKGTTVRYIEEETKTIVSLRGESKNHVFIYGETEEAVKQAELEIINIINMAQRQSNSDEKLLYFIDTKDMGQKLQLQKANFSGLKTFYRLVSSAELPQSDDLHINVTKAVETVLVDMRKKVDREAVTSPLQIDVLLHIGQLFLYGVDESESTASFDVSSVLDKTEIKSDRQSARKWSTRLVPAFTEENVRRLERLLEESSTVVSTCERYDAGFYTPSFQNRRFKIYDVNDVSSTGNKSNADGEKASVQAGAGVLYTSYDRSLIADIFLPQQQYDFSLLIKADVSNPSSQTEEEKKEDCVLIEQFCEKVTFRNGRLSVPPERNFPKGYHLHFERQSKRKTIEIDGFEVIISRQTTVEYKLPIQHEKQEQIDIYVRSKACEAAANKDEGRTWTPKVIVLFIPEMIRFVKEKLNLLTAA
ncbi:uncharacterized protein LOC134185737 isoform X2 [Corticium candelabrum]|uniref:uncharacterized protein LOC134185737 isoform X2 n=1 Tax=Corticium candelabrum TaxID=121492 RepID=UPI002E254ECB|nr:uncharacterized protein LOC134185737 isoform X2 [Corticium candelabrum]